MIEAHIPYRPPMLLQREAAFPALQIPHLYSAVSCTRDNFVFVKLQRNYGAAMSTKRAHAFLVFSTDQTFTVVSSELER